MSGRNSRRGGALAIALAAMLCAGPIPVRAESVLVGRHIAVRLDGQITSATARVGDTFAFRTEHDERLGDLEVPARTLGHGRISSVRPAHERVNGTLTLQADAIDLPNGTQLWVNLDETRVIRGHYSERHRHLTIIPLPIGIVPISRTRFDGDLVIDAGTPFGVVTIPARTSPAPLTTASPQPLPSARGARG